MQRMYPYQTRIGEIVLAEDGAAIIGLIFGLEAAKKRFPAAVIETSPLLEQAMAQLDEYLEGKRKEFTLPLAPSGTPFQQKVWQALTTIPYGQTRTYGEIAAQIGNAKACRAVGLALSLIHISGGSPRLYTGGKENFIGIDIADPGDQLLIEQTGFKRPPGGVQPAIEIRAVKTRVKRFRTQLVHAGVSILFPGGEQPQSAETTAVDKAEKSVIIKRETGVGMLLRRKVRRRDQQLAGHAQVYD